ncbi:MAG: hypothetical protein KIH08_16045 [Candidatus Freyarchaeota archaeon]|nr:hypothetical protein [Candidatus Jordarchaeia archaeon]
MNAFDQIIPDNIDSDSQEEIIAVVRNTVTVYDNDGSVLWNKNYGEPVVVTAISDQNSDGVRDLLAFSKTVYGAYYWKYWIEDVENDITIVSSNLNLPHSIYPDSVGYRLGSKLFR